MGFGDQFDLGLQGTKNLLASLQTLESFKKRVDDQLAELESSEAGPNRIGQSTLTVHHFGKGFTEASELFDAYRTVHTRLQDLSRLFANQIEAMSLLVGIANNDYRDVDVEQSGRLWEIRETTETYVRKHGEPAQDDAGVPTEDRQPTPQQSTAGGEV